MKSRPFIHIALAALLISGCNPFVEVPGITDKPDVPEDPQAKARLVELWEAALAEGGLSDIMSYMEDTAELLDESQELNFKRWKILNQHVHMNFQALGSYEAELGTVRDHINARLQKLDELIRR